MKKVLFLITALLMSTHVLADTYFGIYGVSENDISNTAGEHSANSANIAFGQSMDNNIGLGYEAFFNNAGLGGSVEMFTTINSKYKLSLGAIAIPDNAYRISVDTYPKAKSNDLGKGAYIGFSTKLSGNKYLSIKYIRYDVNHTFNSKKQTGVNDNDKPIFTSKTGYGSAEREQLWVGITFHF